MSHSAEDGVGVSAQRSGGVGVIRVVTAGALLVLAVAAGASWEERGASSSERPARKEALWEGAFSKSLAKHIVRQQAAVAPHQTVQVYSGAAAPPAVHGSGSQALPALQSKHATPTKAAHVHEQPGGTLPKAKADTPADQLAKLAALKSEGILDGASYREAKAKVLANEEHDAKRALTPKAKLFDAFSSAVGKSESGTKAGSKKLVLSPTPQHRVKETAPHATDERTKQQHIVAASVTAGKTPKKGSQEWEREQDADFFDSLGKRHTGAEKRAIREMKERVAREKQERLRFERKEANIVRGKDMKVRDEIAHNEASEVEASLADHARKESYGAAADSQKSTQNDARTPSLVEFWDKQMKAVEHQRQVAKGGKGEKTAPVQFWDEKMKEAAKQRLAAKAAAKTGANKRHKVDARTADAHGPKRGSPEWEREQDAKFFDSLGESHAGAEEKEIRKIKDRVERKKAEHAALEQREREKVHSEDVKAREEQRNAELAAKKYTKSAFRDMDKHLSHIDSDSVTGFKTMEAKELASEVERDHPNESSQQIAARAMKLLGLVMKSRHGDPQVSSAATDDVSPMGPMGVAAQVGGA